MNLIYGLLLSILVLGFGDLQVVVCLFILLVKRAAPIFRGGSNLTLKKSVKSFFWLTYWAYIFSAAKAYCNGSFLVLIMLMYMQVVTMTIG